MLTRYLPGFMFLALAAAAISLPWALLVRNRLRATIFATSTSTVILKTWAYFAIGGFDLGFLLMVAAISLTAAGLVVRFVAPTRQAQRADA